MRNPISKRVLIALLAPSLLVLSPIAANAQDDPDPDEDVQTPEAALQEDLAITAKANDWTFEQAAAQHKEAEAIGEIASKIAEKNIQVLVGSALNEEPGGPTTLYIKGEADEFVHQVIDESGHEVILADGQPYSYLDLEARSQLLSESLVELGYGQFSAYVDITEGVIVSWVLFQKGLPDDPEEIIKQLPKELAQGVDLTVVQALGNENQHAFGGARMSGGNRCTSGWTVVDQSTGRTGVTTAAHCNVNRINEPGVGTWTTSRQRQHRGFWGDVEWHTTNHLEPAEFFASPGTRRPTQSVEQWWQLSVGESVCVFGRTTNARLCNANVLSPWATCFLNWKFVSNLVMLDRDVTRAGDSGGGVSWNTRAYGSIVGTCFWLTIYSKADHYDEAIGVRVRTT